MAAAGSLAGWGTDASDGDARLIAEQSLDSNNGYQGRLDPPDRGWLIDRNLVAEADAVNTVCDDIHLG